MPPQAGVYEKVTGASPQLLVPQPPVDFNPTAWLTCRWHIRLCQPPPQIQGVVGAHERLRAPGVEPRRGMFTCVLVMYGVS
jgi:hypothetical protein